MKKFKTTYILAAILMGLAVYVYFVEFKLSEKKAIQKEKAEKVLALSGDLIEAVTLKNSAGEFFAKRVGHAKWHLEKPLNAPADSWVWDNIVKAATDTKFTRVISENTSDLEPFGLKTPRYSVELHLKNNEKRSFYVGDDNPIGDSVFVTIDAQKKVVLAEKHSMNNFNKTLKDVREKKLFQFEQDQTQALDIFKKEKKLMSLQKENGAWQITSLKSKLPADPQKMTDLFNTLNFLEVKEFEAEDPKDLKKYGLENPALKVILRDEKSAQLQLELGTHEGKDNFVYAKKTGQKPVYKVRDAIMSRIPKTAQEFEKKEEVKK